jgi:hypothetical protein
LVRKAILTMNGLGRLKGEGHREYSHKTGMIASCNISAKQQIVILRIAKRYLFTSQHGTGPGRPVQVNSSTPALRRDKCLSGYII